MARQSEEGLAAGEMQDRLAEGREQRVSGAIIAQGEEGTGAPAPSAWASTRRYANYIFWLMFSINLINYLDRWVFSLVLPLIQKDQVFCAPGHPQEFCVSDFQAGLLGSSFLLIYAIGTLPLGVIADRVKRKNVIAFGVALWSAATFFTGLVQSFLGLLITRAWLGIGEASYNPAGISLLSSYFPGKRRAQILSRWAAGALVGFALGIIFGAVVVLGTGNWRLAFLFTGPPGLIFALLMWKAREPARRAEDEGAGAGETPQTGHGLRPIVAQFTRLLRIRTLMLSIVVQALGLAVITPAALFLSDLLTRPPYNLSVPQTGIVALLLAGASIGGALGGGYLADQLTKRYAGGRLMASGLGFLAAAPCFALAMLSSNIWVLLPFLLLSGAFLNVYSGPLNATMQDAVPPALRASAIALAFMLAHLLGDLAPPSIVGALSNWLDPIHQSQLRVALLITGVAPLVIAGIIGIWGSRFVGREMRAASGLITLEGSK